MLLIDGKRLIPAPTVTLNKSYILRGDGQHLGTNFQINLAGVLVATKGSPNSSGTFHTASGYPADEALSTAADKFDSILRKQDAIKSLFQPGSLLEYGPDDGSPAVTARVKTAAISFPEGIWVDKCFYNVSLEAEAVQKAGTGAEDDLGEFANYYLLSASETISVQTSPEGDIKTTVTQTLSAAGRSVYSNPGQLINSKEPWENAKDWCLTRLSDDLVTYLVDTSGKTKYNKVSSENIDKVNGSYSITITYTVTNANESYVHTYDISTVTNRSQLNDLDDGQQLIEQVTISGQITGLAASNLNTDKLSAALTAFTALESTFATLCGLTPDHLFVSKTVGKSLSSGSVNYSYSYTNYPDTQKYTNVYSISHTASSSSVSQVSINGTIKAVTLEGDTTDSFATAQSAWTSFKSTLRTLAQNTANTEIVSQPTVLSTSYSVGTGEITYNATFNCSDDVNTLGATYLDIYDIAVSETNTDSYQQNNLKTGSTVSINGTITGYDEDGNASSRYSRALSRWNSIKSQLRDRIQEMTGNTIANRISNKSISFNKVNAVISYNFTYLVNDNITSDNIIAEDVQIETAQPSEVFAEQIIPGLSTGSILQNIGTTTSSRRGLSISLVLANGASESVATTRSNEIKALYAPSSSVKFVANDSVNYNPYTGVYTRNISWVYKE